MTVIFVASVILLATCAVPSNPISPLKDGNYLDGSLLLQDREVSADYEPLGCYNLKKLKQQNVVSQIFKKFTAKPGSPLKDCAQKAEEINTPLFGIQKKKGKILCRAGDESKWDPNAKISNKCKNSIGIGNSVFVYRKSRITGIDQKCTFGNKSYSEGEKEKFSQPAVDMKNAKCKECECSKGEFNCNLYHCDAGLSGCEELHHPPGQCCPSCKTSGGPPKCNGRKYMETWLKSVDSVCFFCECLSEEEDLASCNEVRVSKCPETKCKDPVIPEGKCCPECEGQATTQPFFTIGKTTAAPTKKIIFPWKS